MSNFDWSLFGGTKPSKDPRGDGTASLALLRRPWIFKLCRQTTPKRWFANVNMTSYRDVTNSVYPVTMTTIRHCSILEFGRGASNQAVDPGITRPLHATAPAPARFKTLTPAGIYSCSSPFGTFKFCYMIISAVKMRRLRIRIPGVDSSRIPVVLSDQQPDSLLIFGCSRSLYGL